MQKNNLTIQNCCNLKGLTRGAFNISIDFGLASMNKNEITKDLWFVSQTLNQIVGRNMFDKVSSETL